MPVEAPQPAQILAAAREASGKILPLPVIRPENSKGILDAFNQRFDFLELMDSFGDFPTEQLGGKIPGDKLKEESLSQQATSSIYEVMMLASYPPKIVGFSDEFRKDLPAMMESIPPFLRKLSLGEELQAVIAPQYRLDIKSLAAKGPKAVMAEYNAVVDRLNAINQQEDLSREERLTAARDVISLLTLVSHPQTQNTIQEIMIEPPPDDSEQGSLPLSSVAASYLTTYELGEVMGKMLVREVPAEVQPPSGLVAISEKIARGEVVVLDKDVLAQFQGGFVEVKTADTTYRVDEKHFSEKGASIIEQFRRNFCGSVESTIPERSLRTPKNIEKQALFYTRIELLMLGAIKGPLLKELVDIMKPGPSTENIQQVINAYRNAVLGGRDGQPVSLQNVIETFPVERLLQDLALELVRAPRRSFGVAEYLLAQYQAAHDPDLEQFVIAMNELATNASVRQKIGFDQIVRFP